MTDGNQTGRRARRHVGDPVLRDRRVLWHPQLAALTRMAAWPARHPRQTMRSDAGSAVAWWDPDAQINREIAVEVAYEGHMPQTAMIRLDVVATASGPAGRRREIVRSVLCPSRRDGYLPVYLPRWAVDELSEWLAAAAAGIATWGPEDLAISGFIVSDDDILPGAYPDVMQWRRSFTAAHRGRAWSQLQCYAQFEEILSDAVPGEPSAETSSLPGIGAALVWTDADGAYLGVKIEYDYTGALATPPVVELVVNAQATGADGRGASIEEVGRVSVQCDDDGRAPLVVGAATLAALAPIVRSAVERSVAMLREAPEKGHIGTPDRPIYRNASLIDEGNFRHDLDADSFVQLRGFVIAHRGRTDEEVWDIPQFRQLLRELTGDAAGCVGVRAGFGNVVEWTSADDGLTRTMEISFDYSGMLLATPVSLIEVIVAARGDTGQGWGERSETLRLPVPATKGRLALPLSPEVMALTRELAEHGLETVRAWGPADLTPIAMQCGAPPRPSRHRAPTPPPEATL